MKKSIIAICLVALISSGCNDYLDKDRENYVPSKDIDYSDTKNMFKPVIGIYSVAATNFSFWAQYGLLSVRSDEIDKGSSPSDQGELTNAKNFEYSQVGGYWAMNNAWKGLYNIILYSNEALISLDQYKAFLSSDANIKLNTQYQAEVRFLRALSYFYITRLWGNVPLITDNQEVLNNVGKTPKEEIYKYIDSEMDFCIANLADARPNEMVNKGQVTKYSALALRAKLNSDLNDWDKVLTATEQIIASNKFSLFPDFYEYFKKPGRLSNENLYELQFSDLGVGSGLFIESNAWFAFQGPRNGFEGTLISGGWGFLTPSASLEKLFKDRGETVRTDVTFLYAGSITLDGDTLKPSIMSDDSDRVFSGKAYYPSSQMTPGRTSYGLGNNIRMLRYADILLLNAEAKVHKGQNGDAPFNLVRERAKMPALTGVTLDQILEERRVELACEWGERFFDLVRTDKATILPGFKKGESEYYPIPQAQKDLNPNLN